MNKNAELIKEGFDRWDSNHEFWHFERFADLPIYARAKETCPFLSNQLSDREQNMLIYIWHSLLEKQEYDAGNAILLATQTDLLCDESIEKLAGYIISENICFRTTIGKIVFGKIARSIGLWLFMSGRKDMGQQLWQLGIDAAKTMSDMKNSKHKEIQKWREFSERYSIPIELKMLIDELA